MDDEREGVPELAFHGNAFTDTITSMTIYSDCHHGWRWKARDWIRLRRHPSTHVILHSPIYEAALRHLANPLIDFDKDTIRVSFTSDGVLHVHDDD